METVHTQPEEKKNAHALAPAEDTALFCTQLAMVLKAGIPLYDGITTIRENAQDEQAEKVLSGIEQCVKETGSLADALRRSQVFPLYMIQMVEIGERVGKLDMVLSSLATHYEQEHALKTAVKKALWYPLLVLLMMTVVIGVLVWKVLPVFQRIYQSVGATQGAGSQALLNVGTIAAKVALILMIVVIAIVAVLAIMAGTRSGSAALKKAAAVLPGFRNLSYKIAAGRFASVLSLLMKSGYPLEDSIGFLTDVLDNPEVRQKVALCAEKIRAGANLKDALREVKLYTGIPAQLMELGFETGHADSALDKIADWFSQNVNDSLESYVNAIEPTLTAVLSVITGAILLSVMLPLISILHAIG